MDRRTIKPATARFVAIAVALVMAATGCRGTRSEVPPGKPYQTVGNPPTVGFSSDPHQNQGQGMAGLYGNRGPGAMYPDGKGSTGQPGDLVLGTPTQNTASLGVPSDHRYSAPGTSGTTGEPTLGNSVLNSIPPASDIVKQDLKAVPASGMPSGYP